MKTFLDKVNDEIAATWDFKITNTAHVSATEDPTGKDGDAEVTVGKQINLDIHKRVTPDYVISGVQTTVTFTIEVGNGGPSSATGVVISDTVPNDFTVTDVTTTSSEATVHWTSGTQSFTVDGFNPINKNEKVTVTVTTTFVG